MTTENESRRRVTCSDRVSNHGRTQLWAYGYADLADVLGLKEGTLRTMASSGAFHPGDLRSICRLWLRGCADCLDPAEHS